MNQNEDSIQVVYASSEKFSKYLCVSIKSLLNKTKSNTRITILSDGITEDTKRFFIEHFTTAHNKISFIDIDSMGVDEIRLMNFGSYKSNFTTYAKLSIPRLLNNCDKAIYIDCDTLFLDDINLLWDEEFGGNMLCMVPEIAAYPKRMSSAIDIDVVKKTELYCNAGVILFDLKTIREKAILSTIQEKMNGVDFKYADQSIFNLVFNKQIKKLPVKFNLYTPLQKSSYKTLSKYYRINEITTEIDLFQAKKKPIIAHFYGLRQCCKPWNKINACVFSKPYRKTMTALFGKHSLEKWPKSKNAKEKFIEILSFLGNKYLPNSLYMCLKNHKKIT